MNRIRSIALAGIAVGVLGLAPMSSALAQHRHYGVFWPIAAAAALTGAVVGTAAAIVTAPIAVVAAATAPLVAPPYVAPAAVFNSTDYAAPAPAYYPASRTVYMAPPAPVVYGAPTNYAPTVRYYAPPVRYYAPPVRYYAPAPVYYAPPVRYYYRY